MKNRNLIIFYATFLQFITAFFILLSFQPIYIARLGIFYKLFPNHFLGGVLMLITSILAIIGLNQKNKYKFLYFIPQYLFLLLTTGSAVYYIILGRYADGVYRSWQFIFIDQLPCIVTTILYIFSIIDFKREKYG